MDETVNLATMSVIVIVVIVFVSAILVYSLDAGMTSDAISQLRQHTRANANFRQTGRTNEASASAGSMQWDGSRGQGAGVLQGSEVGSSSGAAGTPTSQAPKPA